jgi:ComF family protein
LLNGISDFIAPRHCLVCSTYTDHSSKFSKFICDKCYDNIPFAADKSLILNRFNSNFPNGKNYVSEATSLLNLNSSQNYLQIIHGLKYSKFKSIGLEFGTLLANRLRFDNMLNYDFIIPIPIHFSKKRERGFNQSFIIASRIADEVGLVLNNNILYRHKYTVTQTILDKNERYKNMKDVFSTKNNEILQNKSVLLIDDVLTTGSTVNSAAEILIKNGASKVGVATIALAN